MVSVKKTGGGKKKRCHYHAFIQSPDYTVGEWQERKTDLHSLRDVNSCHVFLPLFCPMSMHVQFVCELLYKCRLFGNTGCYDLGGSSIEGSVEACWH